MYIDKIYTKLYSNKDWNGLNQLVNEIKSFTRKNYEGLKFNDQINLRTLRNGLAKFVKDSRSVVGKDDHGALTELADNVSSNFRNSAIGNEDDANWDRMRANNLNDYLGRTVNNWNDVARKNWKAAIDYASPSGSSLQELKSHWNER